jgi:O-antigen ligase
MYWAILAVIFTLPIENVVQVGATTRISKVAGIGAAVLWMLTVAVTGKVRKPLPVHLAVLSFALWNLMSVYWTTDLTATLLKSFTYIELALLVYILWDTITSHEALRASMQAYVLGAWVSVISLFIGYHRAGAEYLRRLTVGTFEVNALGLVLGLAIPFAWYLLVGPASKGRHRLLAAANLAYIPAAVVAVMLTGSRSAMLSLLPVLVYLVLGLVRLSFSRRVLAASAVAVVVVLLVAKPLVPQRTVQRLGSTSTAITQGSIGGRLETWRAAYETFQDHPLVGTGSGTFVAETTQKGAHNVGLRFLAELGIIGFSLFALILLFTVSKVRRQPRALAGLWITLLLMWAMGAAVHNFEDRKQTWLIVGLVAVGAGLSSEVPRSRLPSRVRLDRSYSVHGLNEGG